MTEAQPATTEKIDPARLKSIIVGSLGNLVEYYDFYVYAAFSLYFAPSFFPKSDETAQMLSSAGIFALGFFMRPIGGWLFGLIGDRYGRRRSLMLSVLMMCGGSLLIAATPTYAEIGVLAPAALMFARLIQGLSLGGEYGASATYVAEMGESSRRGFYSSFLYVTLIGGQLGALAVLLVLQNLLLTPEELRSFGWRIPFVIGAGLALFALWMRRDLEETPAFKSAKAQGAQERAQGGLRALWRHKREAAIVVGLTMGGTLAFYLWTIYIQKFLKLTVGLSDKESTWVSAGALVFALCIQPLYGALSDRIGRRPVLLAFGVMGTLGTVPLLSTLQHAHGPWQAFFLVALGWIMTAPYTSINAVVKAELFPAALRATGVGLPYAVAVSFFGGTAEYVALWFKSQGVESGFYYYASAVICCSLLVYFFVPDTKKTSMLDREAMAELE
ncbi:MFS transporter, MHS family, alpha-ketoglutarate permease [Rhodoblastus acidophilus]|uniref:MFS transporter, MHS family, alpha-ketoglutarate permease n=1 Tax=Rhodoblastus acidophilus TaxID=1074 RepID=A0A212S4H2_RHOAC|nr:MFS transporter [Rhodoblastus acidophilus]PPQ37719.1 alpha-ketoglutarate permease [Rhodoblastus acidophilus]RAI23931.1 alpha-ketoglutarate permease [Rhodoblastus acidophilus]SNB80050.1 MFS transporter, MHS family, alpha-ketoglutarate permease [Rhodoblastus acidophilus]